MPEKVTVYTTDYCPHCMRAKSLLQRKGIEFTEVNLSEDQEKREELSEKTGWMTVPMIFIGDDLIGGADELFALESKGELDKRVSS